MLQTSVWGVQVHRNETPFDPIPAGEEPDNDESNAITHVEVSGGWGGVVDRE